ncbi:23S rRNA (guanosine(2251)-2'-O)-methyltransferase RlmB [Acetobacter sp. AN02]|uniref:23S rRNA (guanosine(2251)-2'-O)-methyltransferase RlmB n=1 Tax=Acetobacter sp. AN02 TaxID=2894186 RepID=UPI0024341527|nr:23S rRNA (guanosine(2251)-2'-O)-methyltransferase RlmB [Acetobacter sp. AN02]MDG6094235.1 23S rRNA (guanosine(2251)-2'-O)-methyltransferase RlmB [Acetobacter sp. AN02]
MSSSRSPRDGSRQPAQKHARSPRRHTHSSSRPGGPCWLAGLHVVQAVMENPDRTVLRLLLTDAARDELTQRLSVPLPSSVEIVERARLDQVVGADIVHQGAAVQVEPLEAISIEDALLRPGPVLVLDQVTDPRNAGAILRSAAAFGAACIVMQDRNAPPESTVLAKAASGALERVPLVRVVNLSRTIVQLQEQGIWTVGLDADGPVLDGASFSGRRVALVLGAEGSGLRRLTRETCDEVASLKMAGGMESLNVSVAAAVGLYELVRHKG